MKSLQDALNAGEVRPQSGALDSDLFVHMDQPNGQMRLTYVRLERKNVTAMVQFIRCDPVKGEPCFNIGWAVPEDLRGQGRAGEVFVAALKELRHGLARNGVGAFWVEGIVGADNKASQRVAEKFISAPVSTANDCYTGAPIVQYLRRIDAEAQL